MIRKRRWKTFGEKIKIFYDYSDKTFTRSEGFYFKDIYLTGKMKSYNDTDFCKFIDVNGFEKKPVKNILFNHIVYENCVDKEKQENRLNYVKNIKFVQ